MRARSVIASIVIGVIQLIAQQPSIRCVPLTDSDEREVLILFGTRLRNIASITETPDYSQLDKERFTSYLIEMLEVAGFSANSIQVAGEAIINQCEKTEALDLSNDPEIRHRLDIRSNGYIRLRRVGFDRTKTWAVAYASCGSPLPTGHHQFLFHKESGVWKIVFQHSPSFL